MCLGVSSDFTLLHCIAGFQHKSGRLQRGKLARSTWDLWASTKRRSKIAECLRMSKSQLARVTDIVSRHTISRALKKQLAHETSEVHKRRQ
jgi:hypothetical protein